MNKILIKGTIIKRLVLFLIKLARLYTLYALYANAPNIKNTSSVGKKRSLHGLS